MSCGRVLVVQHEPDCRQMVSSYLQDCNFEVRGAVTGSDGLRALTESTADVMILERELPDMDGLAFCREVRKRSNLPILLISSLCEPEDKVVGLDVGADDYLGKPFNPRELVARVRALYRRRDDAWRPGNDDEQVSLGQISLNLKAHTVRLREAPIHLTPTEFALLAALVSRAGQVLRREALIVEVWGESYVGDDRVVDVHIRSIRRKLREHDGRDYLVAVRGVGYRWQP